MRDLNRGPLVPESVRYRSGYSGIYRILDILSINRHKENMLFELWENFNIEFHRNSQQAFAYIHVISFILSGASVIEYPTLLFPRY